MALPNITDCWRVGITQTSEGFWTATNIFNVETSDTDSELIANGVGGAFYEDASFAELQTQGMQLQEISVQKYDGSSGADVFSAGDLGIADPAGRVTGDPVSPQVAGVVTWRTGVATRSGRGRSYIAGIAQTRVAEREGKIEASFTGAWAIAAQTFRDEIVANLTSGVLVVISMKEEVARTVTSHISRTALRSQRRRATRVV